MGKQYCQGAILTLLLNLADFFFENDMKTFVIVRIQHAIVFTLLKPNSRLNDRIRDQISVAETQI